MLGVIDERRPVATGVVLALVGEGAAGVETGATVEGSLHPNQPGSKQLVAVLVDGDAELVGAGATAGVVVVEDAEDDVVVVVVVMISLHPNHPGVLQVDVDEVEDEVVLLLVLVVAPLVVLSSRQPHHPGVLQVSVRVLVLEVVVELTLLVTGSVPLLSKNFQLKQS